MHAQHDLIMNNDTDCHAAYRGIGGYFFNSTKMKILQTIHYLYLPFIYRVKPF